MHGLLRPCRHHLAPDLVDRWMGHYCGLCLVLRDDAGHATRLATHTDAVVLAALVADLDPDGHDTRHAGPCVLRGGRTATVDTAASRGAVLAAATSCALGAATLEDKVADRDWGRLATTAARPAARSLRSTADGLFDRLDVDPDPLWQLLADAPASERSGSLEDRLAGTGAATRWAFGEAARQGGRPDLAGELEAAGDAYGRLLHLADAAEDLDDDLAAGKVNPITSSGACLHDARRLGDRLAADVACRTQAAGVGGLTSELLVGTLPAQARRRLHGGARTCSTHGAPEAQWQQPFGPRRRFGRPRRAAYGGYGPAYGPGPGYAQYGRMRGPRFCCIPCCDCDCCNCCAGLACYEACCDSGCCCDCADM